MSEHAVLYHGTLRRHVPAIESDGLVPQIGPFTRGSYGSGPGVVPAVFMADGKGLERVVHAMVAAIIDEVTEDDFEEYDIDPDCHLNDALFAKYGVLFVVAGSDGFARAGRPKPGTAEPDQAEDGDWYSLETVRPARMLKGEGLLAFLSDRGLLPSDVNDFVDDTRLRRAHRPPR